MKEILKKIKPSKDEQAHFKLVTTSFITKLNKNLKDAKAILGGSGAKDTWLAHQHDVDIFVLFKSNTQDNISNILEKVLRKTFKEKIDRVHGSRDYFQLTQNNIQFEVVPILKISKAEQAQNITDISPLHSKWVNKQGKKIKDEIRLTKQFCKANRLYGAESHIGGFSGYVLEIITIYYGSFTKVLEAAVKWKPKTTIDSSKFYKNRDIFMEVNTSKLLSPLIIIDPVDKSRNAAAALSLEKFKQLQSLAKKYLKSHNEEYFQLKPFSFPKKHGTYIIKVEIQPLKGKRDVVGSKIVKVFEHLKRKLINFQIKETAWDTENTLYFRIKINELPKYLIQQGPPISMKEAVKNFKKKNKSTYIENDIIYAKVTPPIRDIKSFANNVFKDKYVTERVKKVTASFY